MGRNAKKRICRECRKYDKEKVPVSKPKPVVFHKLCECGKYHLPTYRNFKLCAVCRKRQKQEDENETSDDTGSDGDGNATSAQHSKPSGRGTAKRKRRLGLPPKTEETTKFHKAE